MTTPSGSTSVWMATAPTPAFSPLPGDTQADVCVIGAGIAGLSAAYLLAKEGKSVVLLEAREIGAGETGRTTAHFFPPDERYYEIQDSFGTAGARLVADAFHSATNLVERIVDEEHIDCGFERLDGYLIAAPPHGPAEIDKEAAAARAAGAIAETLPRVPGLDFDTGPCVRFSNQAQFHPLKYLNGLAQALTRRGGRIFTGTRALDVQAGSDGHTVNTAQGSVRAGAVVIATHTPFNDRVVMHTKQAGYSTYVIGMRVPKGSVPRVLLWDTGDPYYYVRLETPDAQAGHELLIVGGADHKTGQDPHPEDRYAQIEDWTRQHYPMAESVEFRWSGEVMEPADGLAFFGRNPLARGNVFIITGDSGNGMTYCTAGAMLVTDLVMGRDNRWAALFDPARKPVHGVGEFLKEQANVLVQYGDWLKGGEIESVQELPVGEGAILNDGGKKLAVYRDDEGGLHVVSAACTHLGCVVGWNGAEKSWDCPCHASRFNVDGDVLHGPAMTPLEQMTLQGGPGSGPPPKDANAAGRAGRR